MDSKGATRAVKQTTTESLTRCARFLRERHASGAADADFVRFGMATEYLRAFVDNEWTNQMVFGQHPTVSRSNRKGRAFMRADATTRNLRYGRVLGLPEAGTILGY